MAVMGAIFALESVSEGKSVKWVAQNYPISESMIYYYCRKFGGAAHVREGGTYGDAVKEVVRRYYERGQLIAQISGEMSLSPNVVSAIIVRNSIPKDDLKAA